MGFSTFLCQKVPNEKGTFEHMCQKVSFLIHESLWVFRDFCVKKCRTNILCWALLNTKIFNKCRKVPFVLHVNVWDFQLFCVKKCRMKKALLNTCVKKCLSLYMKVYGFLEIFVSKSAVPTYCVGHF